MSWGPLQPAQIDFSDAATPSAPAFGDIYHPRAGALTQARHVFLAGNGLPARWAGRPRWVVLETGFGLGNNFLATWQAWRDDPQRCRQLVYVAIDRHPPTRDDLNCAHAASPLRDLADQLQAHWPPATPDIHVIDLQQGQVRLMLAWGDVAKVLPDLVLQADSIYLDGFAPRCNPEMWAPRLLNHLQRLAGPGATVATWSVAVAVRQALTTAGFDIHKLPGTGGKREITVGEFKPRHSGQPPPGRRAMGAAARHVAVIGAGLAGAAVASALARQGVTVTVLEAGTAPARQASGNAGGLFHGVVHGHDGTHARWLRAAALHCQRVLTPLIRQGLVPGAVDGLLRGEQQLDPAAMKALLTAQAVPPDYLQLWPGQGADTATGPMAGLAGQPAWLYPGGGWVSPGALVVYWLSATGIDLRCGQAVHTIGPGDGGWRLHDRGGKTLLQADAVVLCLADEAARLLADSGLQPEPDWPLQRSRGQITLLPSHLPGLPDLPRPLADGGYALRLADSRLLCGAVNQPDDELADERWADHLTHLDILRRLTGWQAAVEPSQVQGRVAWRLSADDRLPLIGNLARVDQADAAAAQLALASQRQSSQPAETSPSGPTQARFVQRQPGLYVFTALGSRGVTQAALGGELLAAWLTGSPRPVPASLVDAVDPARFIVRAHRRAATA